MLGKVFKMDMREMKSILFPLYGIYLAVVAAFMIFTMVGNSGKAEDNIQFEMIYAIISVVFVVCLIALLLLSGIVIVYYFYRKVATEEAYLTMTLPAKPWEHVVSKLIANGIWQIITWSLFLVTGILLLLINGGLSDLMEWLSNTFVLDDIRMVLQSLMDEFGIEGIISVALLLLNLIISLFTGPLVYFACVSIGQTAAKHKILLSIGAYMVLSMMRSYLAGNMVLILAEQSINLLLAANLAQMLISAVIFYFITVHFLSKNLNLE